MAPQISSPVDDRRIAGRHVITITAMLGSAGIIAGIASALRVLSPEGLVAAIICSAMIAAHGTLMEIRWDRRYARLGRRVGALECRRYIDGYLDGVQRRPPAVPIGSLD